MLLACISVMCVNPISATASRLLADTLAANDLNDVSVRIPAPIALPGTTMEMEMNITFRQNKFDADQHVESNCLTYLLLC